MLHSALFRQHTEFEGLRKYSNPLHRCATLMYGIVKNHPFYDANKRTAFLVTMYFLEKISRTLSVKQKDLENFLVEVSDGSIYSHPRYAKVTKKSEEPEIDFIADALRRFSRQMDKRHYKITYQQLDSILRGYGFCLDSPHNNFINVCRMRAKRKYLIAGPRQQYLEKLTKIGFPSWKAQVGRKDMSKARKATKLTPERGVDSQNFYKGEDELAALVDLHRYPLQRLSDR